MAYARRAPAKRPASPIQDPIMEEDVVDVFPKRQAFSTESWISGVKIETFEKYGRFSTIVSNTSGVSWKDFSSVLATVALDFLSRSLIYRDTPSVEARVVLTKETPSSLVGTSSSVTLRLNPGLDNDLKSQIEAFARYKTVASKMQEGYNVYRAVLSMPTM